MRILVGAFFGSEGFASALAYARTCTDHYYLVGEAPKPRLFQCPQVQPVFAPAGGLAKLRLHLVECNKLVRGYEVRKSSGGGYRKGKADIANPPKTLPVNETIFSQDKESPQ